MAVVDVQVPPRAEVLELLQARGVSCNSNKMQKLLRALLGHHRIVQNGCTDAQSLWARWLDNQATGRSPYHIIISFKIRSFENYDGVSFWEYQKSNL
jgi:hypothetical protein